MALKITNVKNIVINRDLVAGQNHMWEEKVDIGFVPDVMIVKQITYGNTENPAVIGTGLIRVSAFEDYIGSFNDKCSVSPDTLFMANRVPGATLWKFQIDTVAGALDTALGGELSFTMSFIKYA